MLKHSIIDGRNLLHGHSVRSLLEICASASGLGIAVAGSRFFRFLKLTNGDVLEERGSFDAEVT